MTSYAIIGSGISGLSAAFYLHNDTTMKDAIIRVYESSERIGGHSHTLNINGENIDIGFQVSNPKTYPNLYTFFQQIGVRDYLVKTSMSFSVKQPNFEWGGLGSMVSLFSLLTSPSFYKMIFELHRFYNIANQFIHNGSDDVSIDEFVNIYNFSNDFQKSYLYPTASCVWSIGTEKVGDFSAKYMFIFMRNHGMLSFLTYQWYFLSCNSYTYIDKIKQSIGDIINPNHKLVSISRDKDSWLLKFDNNTTANADNIIFACRGEHVHKILQNSGDAVSCDFIENLSKLKSTYNTVSVHRDERDMPKNKAYWSSWNYTSDADYSNYRCTYWIKEIQNIKDDKLFATVHNTNYKPNYKELLFEWTTDHPSYDRNTRKCVDYIRNYNSMSSKTSGLWFCGAYMGYGFHEDGIVSAKRIVECITGNAEYKPF
jgi:predicted NAD/FAD-binding protein